MPDQVRDINDLLSNLFQDGQTSGISAQDLRDLIVSSIGQTGWADYRDTQFTDAAPQVLIANTPNKVLINGLVNQTQELPVGVPNLWDTTTNTIVAANAGTGMLVTFETTIRRASGTGGWELDSWIDIGLPGGVRLYPRTQAADNGSNDKKVTWTTAAYCLDTWVANGGAIYIEPEVAAECYGSRVIIHHTHHGRGTY